MTESIVRAQAPSVDAVRYTAKDGTDVELTADVVTRYMLTGSSSCTDAELAGFMALCRARGLNPLAREAYLVKYGTGPASTIVSKDYYTRTARAQPTFDGFRAGVIVAKSDGSIEYREGSLVGGQTERLVGGWAEVYDKAVSRPFRDEVALSEYSTGKSGWAKMPATMIRKVALVHALREAYPGEFAGLYDAGEMGAAGVEEAPEAPEPVSVEPVFEPARADAPYGPYGGEVGSL